MVSHAYTRRVLRVDLSTGEIIREQLSEEMIRNFVGGRGINLKRLYDEVPAGIDPLGPENRLFVSCGPLTGTMAPSTSRTQCTTKSPLTGILGDSSTGGFFGAELKFAGYDQLIFQGVSEKPVYLWIHNDEVELRDAGHLWGLDTWQATRAIQDELNDREIQALVAGPAGENMVRYAAIIGNLCRAAGRGGGGAVMGSKKLKAIAVRGTRGLGVARPEEFIRVAEGCFQKVYKDPSAILRSVQGTPSLVRVANMRGWLAYKNLQYATNDELTEKLSAESFLKYVVKSKACFNCPLHCSHYYMVKEGPFAGSQAEGLEYIGINCMGLKTGVDYYPAVLKANELANRYGFDVASLGDHISFAMECFEKGVITEKDTDGLELRFGNYEAMLAMIEKIVRREGFGETLSHGVVEAARRIGKGSIQWANHIKGLTIMEDIRTGYGAAMGHSVSNVGAHHLRGAVVAEEGLLQRAIPDEVAMREFGTMKAKDPFTEEAKDQTIRWYERITMAADCLGICKFVLSPYAGQKLTTLQELLTLLSAGSGLTFTEEEFKVLTERVLALERAFNAREGLGRKDDTLPPRMWEAPESGPQKGWSFEPEKWSKGLDAYYAIHGYTKDGAPTKETLEKLGLAYVGEELERMGKYEDRPADSSESEGTGNPEGTGQGPA